MADTDPFGREKGEDPLAEMGWTSSGTSAPETRPTEVAQPERPESAMRRHERTDRADADRAAARLDASRLGGGAERVATRLSTRRAERAVDRLPASGPVSERGPVLAGMPGQRRRPRGLGCVFALVVLVFIGSIGAVVVSAVIDAVEDVDELIPTVPSPSAPPGSGSPPRSANPPRGLARDSLLRRENLAPALRRLRRLTDGSRVRLVRLDAGTLLVQTVSADGRTQFGRATWRGDANVLASTPGGAGTTFSWSRIDPAAPGRIARAATRGRGSASLDYLVLMQLPELQWSAFLRGGAGTFTASADGRRVRRAG